MLKHYLTILSIFFFTIPAVLAQEIQIFKVDDFDLKGKVSLCRVIKDYGQEIFEFNKEGFLVKSTTQYNEFDKDIVLYKYLGGHLVEKRFESYKDNTLDKALSMVNFYEIDTSESKYIKEKIISFDKSFFEQRGYYYNDYDELAKVIVSHENAVDEVVIEKSVYKNETTTTVFENGTIQKSVRKSSKKLKNGKQTTVELTKAFVDGEPNKAFESVYDEDGKLVSEQSFLYSSKENEFVPDEKQRYEYDNNGNLKRLTILTENTELSKDFIFQLDDSKHKNWVKKIITPDNSYVTRRIEYYPPEEPIEE